MKTWEKILLYPIGLCYWIADRAKKAGKFMGRKVKPGIAMLVAVTMLLSLMPLTAFAVSVPSGYTTDENGIMAYAYLHSGNFDIQGYFDGEWKSTTFSDDGYYTYLKQGGYTQSVSASSSANGGFTRDNLNISIDLAFTNEGQTMQILYIVKNIGSQTENFSLGTGADIQIGDDDCAVITPFDDGSGYKMVSDDADDYDSDNDEYAQFNFFATGYKGVTDVSDYWYGSYFSSYSSTGAYWSGNKEAAVFCGNDVSESGTFDSAASWHWANQTLPAGETATYSVLIGIGGADSEDAAESSTHKHCVCGGTGAAGDHTSCEDITWTEWDGTGTFPGGNVYLTDDITLTEALTISGTVNLCLNGHKVSAEGGYFDVSGTLNLCSCEDNGIIKRTTTTNALISADAGATANLYNVTLDGGAVWSGTEDIVLERGTTNSGISSSAPLIDAGYQRTAGGHITLGSGVVLQNNVCTDAGHGGAVTIGEDGTLVINGATICNNAKTGGNAGAIKAYAGAQITMNSGEIYGNEAYKHGGAVQIFGGDSTDYATVVFTMNGGTIRNNKADGVGGGVAVSDYSSFTMNGGTIKDNATTDYSKRGGGVGFGDKNTAMSISGNAVISGNVAGINANNLYIGTNSCNKLTVGTMGNSANVGVTMKSSSGGVFTDGGVAYADKFTSDKPAYIVAADGNNLKLTIPHTHNYAYSATGNVITESCTCGHEETATVSGPTGTIVYDGTEKKGATVSYSTGWLGGTLTVTYQNNINAGQATASITKAGATASVNFTIDKAASGNTLPTGLTATYGETLADVILPAGWTWNTPSQSVGDVGQKTFAAVYTPTNSNYKTVEADLMVTVGKATLTPENFLVLLSEDWSVALPASVTYNGNRRGVTVNRAPDGYTNSGTITVKYYDSNGTLLTSSPRDVGTYTIKLDITEGRCYKAATDLTSPDWTLTIGLASATLTPPTANDLTYNGGDQSLVSVGTATGGSMQYALGADGTTAPASGWSTYVPVGRDAGTYYVWYKVVGDDNHNDVAPACIAVTIAKKQIAKPVADSTTFTYNGSYQTYAMNGDPAFIIDNNMQKNAGSYTVTATLQDTANYEWTDGTTAVLEYTFKIEQKEIGISWSNTALTYNGAAQRPTATATGVVTGEQIALLLSAPETNAGSYTAMVQGIDGETAQNYKLPAGRSTTFTIEQQALTIVWGNSSFTYDGTEKFPAFNVDGIWNADDVEVTHSSAQVNASDTAYTATITGLTGSDAANYKLTGTLTKEFTIAKADQIAPTGLTKADTTYFGKADGKIFGLTSAMEFRKEGDSAYTAGFNGTLEYLEAGTYYVRYQGDVNHNPSPDTAFSVSEGRKLNIIVPQNPIGYTVTVNKTEMEYEGSYTLKVEINEGYTATEDFKIIISSWACGQQAGVEETYMNAIADQIIEVQGVADITAPATKIEVAENGWTTFLNTITFGQFFKENQNVTISATDLGSGVNSIEYYIANGEMTLDAIKAITAWEGYNGTFRINPDNQYVIYAKVTDNAGNITYISSDGLVLDATAPALFGIENNGVYYGDKIFKAIDDHFLKIEIDGIDVTDTTQGDDEYKVTADNAEHTVTVTDKAGNVTEYKITVYKNYTVTFKVDGATVDTQTVGYGKDATAPSIPAKDGYTQTAPAWDKDGKNITADTEINAVYTINKYTVTYKADGEVVGSVTVEHSKDATAPTIPEKEGYTQTAPTWDKESTNITADTEINAVYTINKYTVTYKADGEIVGSVTVEHSKDATAPAIPEKEGYTQTAPAWDKDGKNITADTEINAVYTINKYTVTYKANGEVVGSVTVEHSKDATAPAIPKKEGYTQTAPAWDKDGKNITADTEINAVYTINKYTVTYKANGEVVGSVTVEHSKDATAPAIPEKEGYTQTAPAWDKDGKNITADTEINAVYTINEYTITFMDENGVYKTLTYKHGEAVTMPEVSAKDGYTVTWDTTIEKATGNATVNAVYTKNAVSDNPQTGDNSNLWLRWILLIVSTFGITVICIEQKKRKAMR